MHVSNSILEEVFSVATEITAARAAHYVCHITSGAGVLQYWDGSAYVDYPDSGTGFQIVTPASGRLKVSAACTLSMTKLRDV